MFVVVEGLIVWSILRYRRRPTDVDLPPQTHGNNMVEVLWTLIPTVIVLYLFAISWQTLNNVDYTSVANGQKPDIQIRVLAGQFRWQFEYLDANGNHVATQKTASGAGGGMVVPVGKKVYVTLRSSDVIHAWYVPRFLFKRDVVPGQENHFEFTVDPAEVGQTFHGQCAELCGIGHNGMQFSVVAMRPVRLRRMAREAGRGRERDPATAAVRRAGPDPQRQGHRLRQARPRGAGQRAVRHRLQERRPGVDLPRHRHPRPGRLVRRREPGADRGRHDSAVRVPTAPGRHLPVLLLGASRRAGHDRHPDGQVRSQRAWRPTR